MLYEVITAFKSQRKYQADVVSGATIQVKQVALSELKGELPKGKIGNHEISRLVAGGNLIGGWAHARDLIYASSLFKAYNTEKKVYETLMLAEQAGINTINIRITSYNVCYTKLLRIETAQKIIAQQGEMIKKKTYTVQNRIVSFHEPSVRPIVRGKEGKNVEFGSKTAISVIGGYLAISHNLSSDNYSDTSILKDT